LYQICTTFKLSLVENALKNKQIKFVVSVPELQDIKAYARLSFLSQSEFIRSAIRDKIAVLNGESLSLKNQKDTLILGELKKIRERLDRIEGKEKTD